MKYLNNFKSFFKKYLLSQVSYFSDGVFRVDEESFVKAKAATLFCIVARKHCTERRMSYPSMSANELNALIRLEKKSISTPVKYQIFETKENDGFEVIRTVFEVDEQCKRALFLCPESQLLGEAHRNAGLSLETKSGNLFVHTDKYCQSTYQGGLLFNIESFLFSIGHNNSYVKSLVTLKEYPQFLLDALERISIRKLLSIGPFYLKGKVQPLQLHALYFSPLILVTLYLAGSIGYKMLVLHLDKQQITETRNGVTEVIEANERVLQNSNYITRLSQDILQQPVTTPVWDIVNDLLLFGAEINYVRFSNTELEIDGRVGNATQLLTNLNSNKRVHSAMFNGSVRKENDRDNFNIIVTIKQRGQ